MNVIVDPVIRCRLCKDYAEPCNSCRFTHQMHKYAADVAGSMVNSEAWWNSKQRSCETWHTAMLEFDAALNAHRHDLANAPTKFRSVDDKQMATAVGYKESDILMMGLPYRTSPSHRCVRDHRCL